MAEGQSDIAADFDAIFGDDEPVIDTAPVESPAAAEPAKVEETTDDIADAFDKIEERDRDENGRFKAKEAAPDAAPADAPVDATELVGDEPPAPAIARPQHLPANVADKWDTLPPEVQEWAAKRETETHEAFTRFDRERQVGRGFDAAAAEFKDVIDRDGAGQPIAAVRNLLNTARVLREGDPTQKQAMLNQIATMYGIDIEQAYYTRPAPELAKMQMEMQQQGAQLAAYQSQEARAASSQIEQTITEFAATNEHFHTVAPEMERLARAGVSNDLPTLYNMAISANENLRSASSEQTINARVEQAVAERLATEKASRATQVAKAQRAAISPTSAPGTAKPPGSSPNLSPDELIALDYDRIMSALD